MKKAIFVYIFLGYSAWADAPTGWTTNLVSALAESALDQRPVLAYFTATWCGPCKMMGRTTLPDPAVRKVLEEFHPVALDIDMQRELAQQRDIRAVPTFQLISPTGELVDSTTGYQEPTKLATWLEGGLAKIKDVVRRQGELNDKLRAVDELLNQSDQAALRRAVGDLLDLCCEREGKVGQTARERLTALAERQPGLVISGLQHARLAARIHAANVLRTRLGTDFEIDPWADAATREQAVARWEQKLMPKVDR